MIGFILFPLYGAAIGSLMLINSFLQLSYQNQRSRYTIIAGLSLVAIILPLILVTFRNAQTGIAAAPGSGVDQKALSENTGAVFKELWLREIVPPSLQPNCFSKAQYSTAEEVMPEVTGDQGTMMASPDSVCGMADRIGTTDPQGYYATLAMLVASAVSCAIVSWFISDPKRRTRKL